MTQSEIICIDCKNPYPPAGFPYRCPRCGGLFDYAGGLILNPEKIDRSQPGIWRYRDTFGFPAILEPVSLGEGNTPLIWAKVFDHQVAFKCEFINPSGSFKDRGSAIIAAWLKWRGATNVIEDSSGNAGASLAAFAARAGIKARIFAPESASGAKRRQIESYGAELITIPGSRSDVTEAAIKSVETGTAYASHAYLPFNLPGYATIAYEIFDQLGQIPGAVLVPVGQGGLLLGLTRGFGTIKTSYCLSSIPQIIGVQARVCAPIWALFSGKGIESGQVAENQTLAEGVRVRKPLRKELVLREVSSSGGSMQVVDESEIMAARDALARLGFYVEPTSAIVLAALEKIVDELPDPIVVILTGSGLKYG